ncbi:MAG: DUF488 family protein [Acidobacteria bacterium]|nr:DUF488 family protein [Acidobacteriota bacterium]
MGFFLKSVQLGSARQRGEGLRLGTVRFLPRGVMKKSYARLNYFDIWLPTLAPSKELIRKARSSRMSTKTFFRRYRTEMKRTEQLQLIQLLARLATKTPVSIGCYCPDERVCHRSVLYQLIRGARPGFR